MGEASFHRRVAVALAATAVAGLLQTAFLRLELPGLPPAYFASQLLFIGLITVPTLLALAPHREGRTAAAVLFTVPCLLTAAPIALGLLGSPALLALVTAGLVLVALWSWLPLGRGAPLFAAAAGTVLGGAVLAAEAEAIREPAGLARLGAVAIACLAVALGAGRLPGSWTLPRPATSLVVALLAGAAAGGAASFGDRFALPAPPPSRSGSASLPSVVLIVLDTVRADRLGVYGAEADPMPRLGAFARSESTWVLEGSANSPWTLPSHASMFTGLHPPRHGAHGPRLEDPNPPTVAHPLRKDVATLAGLLAESGYWSVGLSANFASLAPEFGVARGFHFYRAERGPIARIEGLSPWRLSAGWPVALLDLIPPFGSCDFFGPYVPYPRAPRMTDSAIAALDASEGRPLFLFVNYMDAHEPYLPPLAAPASEPVREAILRGERFDQRDILAGERELGAAERERLLALYDAELAYLDRHLGRLLDRLRRDPRWPEMLVVITSDHGEAFGEHGLVTHGHALYEEMLRVPAIVKPGRSTPRPGDGGAVLESIDVFPLALAHAGVDAPAGIDGAAWGGASADTTHAWKFLGSRWPDIEHLQREARSLERGRWKLIENRPGAVELYDLSRDPGELRNLAERLPDRTAQLRKALPAYAPRSRGEGDVVDRTLKESLRALGYVE